MDTIKMLKSPYTIIVIGILIMLASKYIFRIQYMNCSRIINNHISIFKSERTGKLIKIPFFTYMILPLLIALGINGIKIIDEDMINIITVILSILTSMLFTLLVMIIDMKGKIELRTSNNGNQIHIMKNLIKETYYSVMFEILIAISLLVLSFVYLFTQIVNFLASIIIYYLVFLLVFNLFIVLKRIFNIIDNDLRN